MAVVNRAERLEPRRKCHNYSCASDAGQEENDARNLPVLPLTLSEYAFTTSSPVVSSLNDTMLAVDQGLMVGLYRYCIEEENRDLGGLKTLYIPARNDRMFSRSSQQKVSSHIDFVISPRVAL